MAQTQEDEALEQERAEAAEAEAEAERLAAEAAELANLMENV